MGKEQLDSCKQKGSTQYQFILAIYRDAMYRGLRPSSEEYIHNGCDDKQLMTKIMGLCYGCRGHSSLENYYKVKSSH